MVDLLIRGGHVVDGRGDRESFEADERLPLAPVVRWLARDGAPTGRLPGRLVRGPQAFEGVS